MTIFTIYCENHLAYLFVTCDINDWVLENNISSAYITEDRCDYAYYQDTDEMTEKELDEYDLRPVDRAWVFWQVDDDVDAMAFKLMWNDLITNQSTE